MIRTKIVCTIGPASREPTMLEKLMEAGMDVARLNFSHSDHDFHRENVQRIRATAEKVGKPIAIMVDLQGPKLRMGKMQEGGISIVQGEHVTLTTRAVEGQRSDGASVSALLPVQYRELPRDVAPGDRQEFPRRGGTYRDRRRR